MPSASEQLLDWCHKSELDQIQLSSVSAHKWLKELKARIAALPPREIDTPDYAGDTALGLLAFYRPPEDLKFVIARGVEELLAAGANPLSGTIAAVLRGQVFSDDPVTDKMLGALVAAQRAGTPYRVSGGNGNLLHEMCNNNIGVFSHLARDGFDALSDAADVVAAWRDETNIHGKTPVELAWEWYPTAGVTQIEGETAAIWMLLSPGPKGIWVPPDLERVCADGERLSDRILRKVDRGLDVPPRSQDLVEQLRARAQERELEAATPQVISQPTSRSPRL